MENILKTYGHMSQALFLDIINIIFISRLICLEAGLKAITYTEKI